MKIKNILNKLIYTKVKTKKLKVLMPPLAANMFLIPTYFF